MSLRFFDTHAHIHFPDYGLDPEEVWQSAKEKGVDQMIAVGCRLGDSRRAIELARGHEGIWAAVGIHPHEAADFQSTPSAKQRFEDLLKDVRKDKIVAIGECGLDYFYENSPKQQQREVLEFQL